MKPKALVAVVGGAAAEQAVEAALALPGGKSPLFAFAYDYARIMDLMLSAMPSQGDFPSRELLKRLVDMMGVVTMWATPTNKGLSMGMTNGVELGRKEPRRRREVREVQTRPHRGVDLRTTSTKVVPAATLAWSAGARAFQKPRAPDRTLGDDVMQELHAHLRARQR